MKRKGMTEKELASTKKRPRGRKRTFTSEVSVTIPGGLRLEGVNDTVFEAISFAHIGVKTPFVVLMPQPSGRQKHKLSMAHAWAATSYRVTLLVTRDLMTGKVVGVKVKNRSLRH